jgi:hypothetical protein
MDEERGRAGSHNFEVPLDKARDMGNRVVVRGQERGCTVRRERIVSND